MHEFEIIKKYFSKLSLDNKNSLKLNDDVFFDKSKELVISVDTYIDKSHFFDFKDPDEFLNSHTPEDYFNLIDNSSFWIDWQIDQIFKDKDLTNSENFQSVISLLVKLLSKLPQSSTRTHYLQKVSEQLSKGQARLAIQFEQDLRNQIKGFRWHGRSKKFEQPNEISRREKNESEIIFYYLHCPDLRLFIRDEFLKREINGFSTKFIQNLWEIISKIEQTNLRLKDENESLKITINNLNKQIVDFRNELYDQKQIIAQYNIDLDEIEFLRLNLKFGHQCHTSFLNNENVGHFHLTPMLLLTGQDRAKKTPVSII